MTNLSPTADQQYVERKAAEMRESDAGVVAHIGNIIGSMFVFDQKPSSVFLAMDHAKNIDHPDVRNAVNQALGSWDNIGMKIEDAPTADFGREFFAKLERDVLEGDKYRYENLV